jgi:hypothetical protein
MDLDPDLAPDSYPALFGSGSHDAKKVFFFSKFFGFLLIVATLASVFKINKSLRICNTTEYYRILQYNIFAC